MTIICGDCLEEMRKMEDNSISAIVTDPPYGLSFMGKEWDHAIPGIEYWKECLRITKPGSFLIAMGGTRTFHRITCAIEDAGWQIRDCISWLYASGFPKSHNNFGLEGYGTALKPSWEPCIVSMKPCDGTFKQNAEKWGQAGINIDACRIASELPEGRPRHEGGKYSEHIKQLNPQAINSMPSGRWPANVIFDEIAAAQLDEQSGILKSGSNCKRTKPHNSNALHPLGILEREEISFGDSGGASRFFYCAKASSIERNEGLEGMPDVPEGSNVKGYTLDVANGNDRNKPTKNHHPTVKPLKLMEYLIKLVMPPKDGILLDPFAGSGTTILAAKRLGFNAIGIEKSEEYCEIARQRVNSYQEDIKKSPLQSDFINDNIALNQQAI